MGGLFRLNAKGQVALPRNNGAMPLMEQKLIQEGVFMELKKEILEILRADAKIENKNIAAMLGSTEQEVAAAIREMEEAGIILRYGITVNSELLGEDAPAEALIEIKVAPKLDFGYDDIARRIDKFPEVKSPYLRRAIWTAANRAAFSDPALSEHYQSLRARGKHHLIAVGAVARKMCNIIFAVMRDNKPYVPNCK